MVRVRVRVMIVMLFVFVVARPSACSSSILQLYEIWDIKL